MPDSELIVQAFKAAISPLGERSAQHVLADLPYHGVFLNDPELTLSQLAGGINSLFNDDEAHLVLERVLLELDRLYTTLKIQ